MIHTRLGPRSEQGPRHLRIWMAVLAVPLALAGCGSGSGSGNGSGNGSGGGGQLQPGGQPTGIDGGWTLTAGNGPDGPLRLVGGRTVSLILADDRVSGTAACNGYGGTVRRTGSGFLVGELAITEMACTDDGVMELESAYLAALAAVRTVATDGGGLVLRGTGVELTFSRTAPVPDAAVERTAWTLTALYDDETVSSTPGGARLRLDGTGRLTGGTGCRDFTAGYALDGATLMVTELRFADLAVADCVAGARAQDAAVAAVLAGPITLEVTGPGLTLRSGVRGLGFTASS